MSALQGTILNTIQLAVTPVIIVSEHDTSLSYFSLLLSNHLLPQDLVYKDRALLPHDNFFNTPFLNHLIRIDWNKYSITQLESMLSLHLEEGFDTKRLYGLALSIESYQKLKNSELLSKCVVIFIYSEFKSLVENERRVDSKDLIQQLNKQQSILFINNKILNFYPKEVIQELSHLLNAQVLNTEKIRSLRLQSIQLYYL